MYWWQPHLSTEQEEGKPIRLLQEPQKEKQNTENSNKFHFVNLISSLTGIELFSLKTKARVWFKKNSLASI